MAEQSLRAVAESDRVVLIVDAREGLTRADEFVAQSLRRSGKPVVIAVNKSESRAAELASAEFHGLALGDPVCISAAHEQGIRELMERVLEGLTAVEAAGPPEEGIRVAVIGRPNVGKSTLVNRLLGEERVIASEEPGTTRDSILIPFERDGVRYTLIDTAGVRRRARVDEGVERFSVIKTLQAIASAHVVIAVLDAQETVAEQDASLLGLAVDRGRALVIGVNKWDALPAEQREVIRSSSLCGCPSSISRPCISSQHAMGAVSAS